MKLSNKFEWVIKIPLILCIFGMGGYYAFANYKAFKESEGRTLAKNELQHHIISTQKYSFEKDIPYKLKHSLRYEIKMVQLKMGSGTLSLAFPEGEGKALEYYVKELLKQKKDTRYQLNKQVIADLKETLNLISGTRIGFEFVKIKEAPMPNCGPWELQKMKFKE